MTKVDKDNIVLRQTVGIDKLVFLLDGFALENAIKAFLVYEKPRADANRIAHVLPVDKNTTSATCRRKPRSQQGREESWQQPQEGCEAARIQ